MPQRVNVPANGEGLGSGRAAKERVWRAICISHLHATGTLGMPRLSALRAQSHIR